MENMDSLPSCKYLSLNFYASEGEGRGLIRRRHIFAILAERVGAYSGEGAY